MLGKKVPSCSTSPQYSRCNLRLPVQKIQASITSMLDGMTLAELGADAVVPVAALTATR